MTDVKAGQVWADADPRSTGRTLRVDRIEHGKAVCVVVTNYDDVQALLDGSLRARQTPGLDRRGAETRISLSRFKPTSTGYRLLSEPED